MLRRLHIDIAFSSPRRIRSLVLLNNVKEYYNELLALGVKL
jgi:hypothetical protein